MDTFKYPKDESSDHEEYHTIKNKIKQYSHKNNHKQEKHEKSKKSYKQNKSLYAKGVSDSSEETSDLNFNSDREETLCMEIKTNIDVLENEDKGKETID